MTWLIVAAVLFAWGPLALGLGLLIGPALRRGQAPEAPSLGPDGVLALR